MNLVIVGYGKMGKLYDSLFPAKYIVDICPVHNHVYFNHLDKFIRFGHPVDLVIVATPTPNHFETVKKLLNFNYNVLCEKPLCFSSEKARLLEKLAAHRNLILYQSTLERYNPVIKYIKTNIALWNIKSIESYRFGLKPAWNYSCDPKYDLGIHDVDLWFYLTQGKTAWQLHCGYGTQQREMIIYLKNGEKITVNLLDKYVVIKKQVIKFNNVNQGNPMVEMINNLMKKKTAMNELWSKEIEILERAQSGNSILLK